MRSRNWRQHLHSQLSKAQKEAVMHKDGPMMVLAGPGSGKTLVITKRIQYLISRYQIPPQRILVITFTRAAANEMKERFWRLAGETLPVSFGTFHSVFFTILKYAYHYSADNILPEHKKYDFIREIITDHELEIDDEADFMRQIIQEISLVKGQMIPIITVDAVGMKCLKKFIGHMNKNCMRTVGSILMIFWFIRMSC